MIRDDEKAWALSRAKQVAEAIARNIRFLEGRGVRSLPCALPLGDRSRPRGGTYVVVGAGPSLSRTGHLLPAFREAGACIVTVNSALSAVRKILEPDVVVAREIADISEAMSGEHEGSLHVLDVATSSRVFEQSAESGPAAWFVSATPSTFELAFRLGVRPLYGGSAALTAAVALCDAWGAAEVILLGVDLAIGPDGSTYVKGSPYEGRTATVDERGTTFSGPGFEKCIDVSVAAGISLPAKHAKTISVPEYGGTGGRVYTQGVWVDQIEWLSNRAWRDMALRCVDATGEGAAKPGWFEMTPSAALDALRARSEQRPVPCVEDVPPGKIGPVLQWFGEQNRTARMLAHTAVHPDGCVAAIPGLGDMDLVQLAAAPGQLRVIDGPGGIREKIKGVYGALGNAADGLDAILSEPHEDEHTIVG